MSAVLSLSHREILRFYRQKSRFIASLITPLIFWLLLGSGLEASFPMRIEQGGLSYLQYFFPGALVLSILFSSIFVNISTIEDRNLGFLQSVLVAPVPRYYIVLGKVLGGSAVATLQAVVFLGLGFFSGLTLSPLQGLEVLGTLTLLSLLLTSLGFFCAWWFDSVQSFHSIMNLLLFPMWLLSGTFFSLESAPVWLKPLMLINPLTYGLLILKSLFFAKPIQFGTAFPVAVLAIGAAGLLLISAWVLTRTRGRGAV